MSIKIISNNNRNLTFSAIAIIILIIFLIGFRMYGSSVISEANETQTEWIRECENLTGEKKKYFDQIFQIFNDNNVNCFLFKHTDNTIDKVTKKFENVADLRKMKIEGSIKLNNTYFEINHGEKDILLKLNYNQFADDELVEEKSWSGVFYKITGGYSLPATLLEIFNHLQSLKSKLDKGRVGAAFWGDNVHIFFYNENENKVEDIYAIRSTDDKLTALDIFKFS
ncbi:hypothetical protein DMUE_4554 [Dictyocoela muelleri]|nr:hypothetical protein DMUE_4554 [Dictyocoela muelleri]